MPFPKCNDSSAFVQQTTHLVHSEASTLVFVLHFSETSSSLSVNLSHTPRSNPEIVLVKLPQPSLQL